MGGLYTFPSQLSIDRAVDSTPNFMWPSRTPYAVMLEGGLTCSECDDIQERLGRLEPYGVTGCSASTRECVDDPSLNVVETIARNVNDMYFKYDLDAGQHSWLQSYGDGDEYQRHMDGSPGQTRKLTAVVMLSDPKSYDGGKLTLFVTPKSFIASQTRGTIIVFQPWIEHEVSTITAGNRQSLNMGFWGPHFR